MSAIRPGINLLLNIICARETPHREIEKLTQVSVFDRIEYAQFDFAISRKNTVWAIECVNYTLSHQLFYNNDENDDGGSDKPIKSGRTRPLQIKCRSICNTRRECSV